MYIFPSLHQRYGGRPVSHTKETVPRGYASSWIKYIGCPLHASTLTDCEVTWKDNGEPIVNIESGAVICNTEPMEGITTSI